MTLKCFLGMFSEICQESCEPGFISTHQVRAGEGSEQGSGPVHHGVRAQMPGRTEHEAREGVAGGREAARTCQLLMPQKRPRRLKEDKPPGSLKSAYVVLASRDDGSVE